MPGSVMPRSSPTPQPALGQKPPFLLQRHSDVVGRKPAVRGGNRDGLGAHGAGQDGEQPAWCGGDKISGAALMGWGRPLRRVNAVTAGFGTPCSRTVYLSTWQTMTLALWMGAGAGLGGLGQRDGQHNTHAEDKVKRSCWGKGEGGCKYLGPLQGRWTGAGDPTTPSRTARVGVWPLAEPGSDGRAARNRGSGFSASGLGTDPLPAARHAQVSPWPQVLAPQPPKTARGAPAGARSLQHLLFPPAAIIRSGRALPTLAPRRSGGAYQIQERG